MLPFAKRRRVGPYIFFDHIGPLDLAPGVDRSVDVRPHPHIGLSTVTSLFAGEIMHPPQAFAAGRHCHRDPPSEASLGRSIAPLPADSRTLAGIGSAS